MTRLTELALRWPAITFLALAGVLIGGLWAARSLDRELIPEVELPEAAVLAAWPDAAADQVVRDLVPPIEAALAGIDEVPVVEVSATAADGLAVVRLRTEQGTGQAALRDAIRARRHMLDLPEGAAEPEIVLADAIAPPVVRASVRASRQDLDSVALQRLIEDVIVPEVEAVAGVGRVLHVGGADEKIFLNLDPAKMATAGVTLDTIHALLAAHDVSLPAGELRADGRSIPLRVGHGLRDEADLAALALGPHGGATGAGERRARGASGTATPDRAATRPAGTGAVGRAASPAPEPTGSATAAVTATPRGSLARLQVVVVVEGDTLIGLGERYGVSPDLIRQLNGLGADDPLLAGSVLRIPLAAGDDRLPPLWQAFGVTRAGEIMPGVLDRALAEAPAAVSNLTGAQLLALPSATVRRLPLPLVARQPDEVRLALARRMGVLPSATPSPAPDATPASAAGAGAARPPGPSGRDPSAQPGQDQVTPVVRLGDVATITREVEVGRTIHRSDGRSSQGLLVFEERGANTVATAQQVLRRLEALESDDRLDGIEWQIASEQATFVDQTLARVRNLGLLGGLLAVLIALFFLGFSARATLVIAVGVPLAILSALLLMQLRGLTLNLLTLAGLVIALGRVAGDAFIVLESIDRPAPRGEDGGREAAIAGTRAVAGAVTAATLVAVVVSLPLVSAGGVTRALALPFAQAMSYALVAGLIVALMVVPLLASRLPRREHRPEQDETSPEHHATRPEQDATSLDPGETWLERAYMPVLTWVLDHRLATVLLASLLAAASLAIVGVIQRGFLPSLDGPTVQVELALPPGTALASTDAAARRIEARLMVLPGITAVETTVGRDAEGFDRLPGDDGARAVFFAVLADGADAGAAAARVRKALDGLRDETGRSGPDRADGAEADPVAAGMPMTFTVNTGAVAGPRGNLYGLRVQSDDEAALREVTARILAALGDEESWRERGYGEVPIVNLRSDLTPARDVVEVDVDPAAAIQHGLTADQVAAVLRAAIEGQALGQVELAGPDGPATLAVVARYPDDDLDTVAALADFEIEGRSGAVRLGDIAAIRERPGPARITRIDGRRAALISGLISSGDTFGVGGDAAAIIADLNLDEVTGAGLVEVGLGLASRRQRQEFSTLLIALPIAIIAVFLIMVVTFGSLHLPFSVLFSLPFALSGALAGLALAGRPLGLAGLIGLLTLIGIVTANAIVLVEPVRRHRAHGLDARAALLDAGRTRVRPFIVTALATVVALLPLAFGPTEGAFAGPELAAPLIGGLVAATLLTLIVVPVIYSLLDSLRTWAGMQLAPVAPVDTPVATIGTAAVDAANALVAGAPVDEMDATARRAEPIEEDAGVAAAAAAAASDVAARSALLTDTGAIQAIPASAPAETTAASERPLDTGEVPIMPG